MSLTIMHCVDTMDIVEQGSFGGVASTTQRYENLFPLVKSTLLEIYLPRSSIKGNTSTSLP